MIWHKARAMLNSDNFREEKGHMLKKGMLLNGLMISCTLYIASVILAHEYDWDIDQFMYFGSRLANGELAFVREYDDKSVAVHALFLIPFWLKSIRFWYIMSTVAASAAAYFLYKTLIKTERRGNEKAAISAIYFAFMMISTRGGINHINGMAACMTLACICGIALSETKNTQLIATNKIPIYILLGAWSTSIRPYYILTTLAIITWPALKVILTNNSSESKNRSSLDNQFEKHRIIVNTIGLVGLLATFITSINILPYILTGEGKALADAFLINKISITPGIQKGIVSIFFIAMQKAPLIIAPVIASNILMIMEIFRGARAKNLNIQIFLEKNIDIIYSGSLMPLLLAIMMSTRHFHNHYLALFAPFSAITLYFLLSRGRNNKTLAAPHRQNNSKSILRKASQITIGLGLTYHCIYPIVKINEQFSPWSKVRTQGRENILKELEALTRIDGAKNSFVVTRDNHFHWRLKQSRMGIPHASLLSKIATNYENIGQATSKASQIKTKFKYPSTSQLCNTMMVANPDVYLVPKNTLEDNCLNKENSDYSFYKEVEKGHTWNLTKTKIGVIYVRSDEIMKKY